MLWLDANTTLNQRYVLFNTFVNITYQRGDQYLPSIHSWDSGPWWVLYILLFCFACVFVTVCRVVLVFFKCIINLTSFLFKSTFFSLLLFNHFFFLLFLLLLIKQFFSHETVKVSRLFCFLFLELKLEGNNPQFYYFSPVPKRFTMFFIYFHFNISLHFILKFTSFITTPLVIYFNSYQWAECLRTTLAGFFLGGVHWQWPWTLLRIDPRVLGDVLHSVMFPFLYLFLFLCNILT